MNDNKIIIYLLYLGTICSYENSMVFISSNKSSMDFSRVVYYSAQNNLDFQSVGKPIAAISTCGNSSNNSDKRFANVVVGFTVFKRYCMIANM